MACKVQSSGTIHYLCSGVSGTEKSVKKRNKASEPLAERSEESKRLKVLLKKKWHRILCSFHLMGVEFILCQIVGRLPAVLAAANVSYY